jgi:hypothetical protein
MVMPASERAKIESKSNASEKVLATAIEVAKEDVELRSKIADLLMEKIDKEDFKEKLIEFALKDSELRKKIMLELLKKI